MGSTKASKGHGAREAPRHKSAAKGTWVGHLFKKLLGLNPKPQVRESSPTAEFLFFCELQESSAG